MGEDQAVQEVAILVDKCKVGGLMEEPTDKQMLESQAQRIRYLEIRLKEAYAENNTLRSQGGKEI